MSPETEDLFRVMFFPEFKKLETAEKDALIEALIDVRNADWERRQASEFRAKVREEQRKRREKLRGGKTAEEKAKDEFWRDVSRKVKGGPDGGVS